MFAFPEVDICTGYQQEDGLVEVLPQASTL